MIILPAIDIKDGRCVRLLKGDFATVHTVAESAYETARSFLAAGAEIAHIVDLDGALGGAVVNWPVIGEILRSGIQVELGGGIRTMEAAEECFEKGIFRVILGSAALRDPGFVREAARRYPGRIAVGIDARDGFVRADGWLSESRVYFIDLARQMEGAGVSNIIFTDIGRDGTLAGPNLEQLSELAAAVSCDITASGGVKNLDDIRALSGMGLYGAIAGKAVYSGTLDLREAVEYLKGAG